MWYSKRNDVFSGLGDGPYDFMNVTTLPGIDQVKPFSPQGVTVPFDEGGGRGRGPGTPGTGSVGFSIMPGFAQAVSQVSSRGFTLDSLKKQQQDLYKQADVYFSQAQVRERSGDSEKADYLRKLSEELDAKGAELERLIAEKEMQEKQSAQLAAALAAARAVQAVSAQKSVSSSPVPVAIPVLAAPPSWLTSALTSAVSAIAEKSGAVYSAVKQKAEEVEKGFKEFERRCPPSGLKPAPEISQDSIRSMEAGEGMTNKDYKAMSSWVKESQKAILETALKMMAARKSDSGSVNIPGVGSDVTQDLLRKGAFVGAQTTGGQTKEYRDSFEQAIRDQYEPALMLAGVQAFSDPQNGIPRFAALWESMRNSALKSGAAGKPFEAVSPPVARPGTGDPEFYGSVGMPGYQAYGPQAILESSKPRSWDPEHGVEEGWGAAKKSGKKLGSYGRPPIRRLG